ncbi:MAG: hypothetical protein AAFQ64_08825 [Pseudomonadota bacterium]
MRVAVFALVTLGLIGCGANGAPLRPTSSANLSVGTNGVSAGTNVGVTNGAFSLNLGQSFSN